MKDYHLWWILPLTLALGFMLGFWSGFPEHLEITIDYGENITRIFDKFNATLIE